MDVNSERGSEEIILESGGVTDPSQQIAADLHRYDHPSNGDASRDSKVDSIIQRIEMKVNEVWSSSYSSRPSIWRVPPELRNLHADAFEPKVVSIGPLHHGKSLLLPGENLKLMFIKNHGTGNIGGLRKCAEIVFDLVREARERYWETIDMSDEEFVEVLVVDGYFIILFLAKWNRMPELYPKSFAMKVEDLMSDIMLLENQIPLFVICRIYEEMPVLPWLNFFDFIYGSLLHSDEFNPQVEAAFHLLDVQQMLLRKKPMRDYSYSRQGLGSSIRSLTDMKKAGIKLKRSPSPIRLMPFMSDSPHIYFIRGTLEIPFLKLTTQTARMMRNLMAFEHGREYHVQYTTMYCCFVRNIIQTVDDVAILRRSGVLENRLGSDAKVFEFFQSLGMQANVPFGIDHLDYFLLLGEVEKFCKVRHHSWRASFVSNYFSSPWKFLSVFAAVLLLSLTATQTFFTVFPRG